MIVYLLDCMNEEFNKPYIMPYVFSTEEKTKEWLVSNNYIFDDEFKSWYSKDYPVVSVRIMPVKIDQMLSEDL